MYKCDVSQHKDKNDFYLKISNNAFNQSDFNNRVFLKFNFLWQTTNL